MLYCSITIRGFVTFFLDLDDEYPWMMCPVKVSDLDVFRSKLDRIWSRLDLYDSISTSKSRVLKMIVTYWVLSKYVYFKIL